MNKRHYLYRITDKVRSVHYYGIRSCDCDPAKDLGIKYFSSSRNKEFRLRQKLEPNSFKYKVVREYKTRLDASLAEVQIHARFDVSRNASFVNLAKATTELFDVSGLVRPEEFRRKVAERMKSRVVSDETREKISNALMGNAPWNKGVPTSESSRKKLCAARKGIATRPAGFTHTEETKRKVSEAKKLKPTKHWLGKTRSEADRKKMSEAAKLRHAKNKSKQSIEVVV